MSERRAYALDDHFLRDRMAQVIVEQNIQVVVETGIANGDSSLEFCRMAPRYVGIDIDPDRISVATQTLQQGGVNNWDLICGDSAASLRDLVLLGKLPPETLYFLDAHNFHRDPTWPKPTWPMPEEIRAIPPGQGVICLHDFSVPGKDFGVDGYWIDDGSGVPGNRILKPFDYDLIRPYLTEWSATHRLEYMQESDPASSYRGAAFVYPS